MTPVSRRDGHIIYLHAMQMMTPASGVRQSAHRCHHGAAAAEIDGPDDYPRSWFSSERA